MSFSESGKFTRVSLYHKDYLGKFIGRNTQFQGQENSKTMWCTKVGAYTVLIHVCRVFSYDILDLLIREIDE